MKKCIAWIMILVLLTGLFSGCDNTETPPVTPPATEPTPSINLPGEVGVSISEVMPQNKNIVLGHEYDWVELYNQEDVEVNLEHYYLTDDLSDPHALSLANITIPADGYAVIVLDENVAFGLSSVGETIYLVYVDDVISQVSFGMSDNGESFDAEGVCQYPTPGYANTLEGYRAYLANLTLPELIINEAMTSNNVYVAADGGAHDMVEIRNNSDQPIDLSQYTLTDKRSEPNRYTFPAVILQPGEFFVVYCSGDEGLGQNHTSFKLSSDGETIYLAKQGKLIDALVIPGDVMQNNSYGRVGNVAMYLTTPTFGSENSEGYEHMVQSPLANVVSGVYQDAFSLTLSGEGEIYYTLDGTRPTAKSAKYTGPIAIDGVMTVRTVSISGGRSSEEAAYTYIVGVEHSLPVLNIAISQEALTGEAGVLNHIDKNYEYEAMLTLIENGEEKFSVPFGFRLHGNDSRTHEKQNFQLRFRSAYGAGKLNYQVFENLDITEFNSLLLKGGGETWMLSMLTEELSCAIANGTTNVYVQASRPVVLYLGGEFWGVYFIRERFSDDYVASHLNVSTESVDLLYSTAASIQNGSNKDFLALRNYVQSHDMTLEESFTYLTEQIDVMSLIDWYICRSYVGDRDLANIRRFRSSEYDGKWRWMYFDLDWSFWNRTSTNPVTWNLSSTGGDRILIQAVLKNPTGRDMFLMRYAELMDTVLNEQYIIGKIDSMVALIQDDMHMDRERWGRTYEGWEKEVENLRKCVRDGVRNQMILADLQSYFGLTDAEMEYYFGS